jgi:hypothetical protein
MQYTIGIYSAIELIINIYFKRLLNMAITAKLLTTKTGLEINTLDMDLIMHSSANTAAINFISSTAILFQEHPDA